MSVPMPFGLGLGSNPFDRSYFCEVSIFVIKSFYSDECTNHRRNIFPGLQGNHVYFFLKVQPSLGNVWKKNPFPHFPLPSHTLA